MPSNPAPFVRKTFELVTDETTNDLVSWTEDGDSFVIHKPEEFQKEILPFYFKHNNLCSFVRQLNTYGFHKVGTSKNGKTSSILEFKQPQFLRGKPQLLKKITRRKSNKRSFSEAFDESPSYDASSPELSDDVKEFLMDRNSMADAISTITARQEETKSQIQCILNELREAKKLIEKLESLPDEEVSAPPQKKIKIEQPDPIDEFWMMGTGSDLTSFDSFFDFTDQPSTPSETLNSFDLKEFLFHENPCIQV